MMNSIGLCDIISYFFPYTMGEVNINCLVVGEDPRKKVFSVKIDNRRDILELKRLIKDTKSKVFEYIVPSSLRLWKVKISCKNDEELDVLKNKDFRITDIEDRKLLS